MEHTLNSDAEGDRARVPADRDAAVTNPVDAQLDTGETISSGSVPIESMEILSKSIAGDESLYRMLFTNAADGIWLVDTNGQIIDANAQSCRDLGYSAEELRGLHVVDIDEHWNAERLGPIIERQLESKRPVLVDGRQRRKDGSTMHVEVSSRVLELSGQPFFLATIRDVSRRVEAMEEVERQNALLERSRHLESLGSLAGRVAHDINNLLTPILLQVELLADGGASVPDTAEIVTEAALRARDLTQQLLLFSRRHVLQARNHDLSAIVRSLKSTLRQLVREDIKIRYDLDIGPVRVDEMQVAQAVLNLVMNAQDAMPNGGHITIDIADNVLISEERGMAAGTLSPGEYVTLRVLDEGPGLPPKIGSPRLFDPFFTTKDSANGSGLGLATVDAIMQQHGGAIECENVADEGAAFTLYLPRHVTEPTNEITQPAPPPPEDGLMTILLVEDDTAVREVVARSLERTNCHVRTASNGADAIQLAADMGRVDLLLSDVVMPKMNGPTLAIQLRRSDPRIKVLFMTAYAAQHQQTPDAEMMNARFLSKPFTPDELVQAVRETLAI